MNICSQQQFDALKSKAYRNIPRPLLGAVIKNLPDYAAVVYLSLYDAASSNLKYPDTVMISCLSLAKQLDKSVRSISRALQKLKKEGFIDIQDKDTSHSLVNIIRVGCPDTLAKKILKEEPNRKTIIPFMTVSKQSPTTKSKPLHDLSSTSALDAKIPANPENVLTAPSFPNPDNRVASTDLKTEPVKAIEELYSQYQASLKKLRAVGLSPLRASRQAFLPLKPQEVNLLQQYLLNLDRHPAAFVAPSVTKMSGGMDKNVSHIRILNKEHSYCSTIEGVSTKSIPPPQSQSAVDLKKTAVVTKALTAEHALVTKRILALYQYQEIHPLLKTKYLSPETLIFEVMVHVTHRNFNKTLSIQHALNAALSLIRKGEWSTPKKISYWQSLKREQEMREQKNFDMQNETALYAALKPFFQKVSYSSQSIIAAMDDSKEFMMN